MRCTSICGIVKDEITVTLPDNYGSLGGAVKKTAVLKREESLAQIERQFIDKMVAGSPYSLTV